MSVESSRIAPLLMFTGQAQEAMNFYVSLFPNSSIRSLTLYKKNEPGKEGSVQHATFVLDGAQFFCIDSPPVHAFSFTPSISLAVSCATENEVERLFNALADGGKTLMPLSAYPFSKKFGWVTDRFGVSWQLKLA